LIKTFSQPELRKGMDVGIALYVVKEF